MIKEYYDAASVKAEVSGQIEDIVKSIFPAAKKVGQELRVGGLDGKKGNSMGVSLRPDKFGQWGDLATSEKGDIITLIQEVKGLNYGEAITYLAEKYTSLSPTDPEKFKPMREVKIPSLELSQLTQPKRTQKLNDYAVNERKISEATLDKYNVHSGNGAEEEAAFLHYFNNKLAKVHYSSIESKSFRSTENPIHTLWGRDYATPEKCKGVLTITEGQWDAMSYNEVGIIAVSMPSGVSNMKWIESDWDYLAQFHTFIISFDMDDPGRKATETVVKRLGVDKCMVVSLPLDDASDMLQNDYKDKLVECHKNAKYEQPSEIVSALDIIDDVMEDMKVDRSLVGTPFYLPIDFRVRDHEMTLVFGEKGHGKSQVVLNQMAYEVCMGRPVMIFSGESQKNEIFRDIVAQASGYYKNEHPENLRKVMEWIGQFVFIYDTTRKPTPKQLIQNFIYVHKKFGIRRFVLDNITIMKIRRGDYDEQAQAADDLRVFTKEYPIHLFAVAHSRKGEASGGYSKPPHENDIRGAGEWGDLAENIMAVWRNKKKSEVLQELINDGRSEIEVKNFRDQNEDGKVILRKQRYTGKDCFQDMWFQPDLKIFYPTPGDVRAIRKLITDGVIPKN